MINSTQSGLDIELYSNEKLQRSKAVENRHSEVILQQVDSVLKFADITPRDVDYVGICVGPGSFTGIRVAISVAKAFAVATNCKLVTFNTFELYSYNIVDASICIVNGFSNFYYAKIDSNMDCIAAENLKRIVKNKKVICEKCVADKLGISAFIEPHTDMWPLVQKKVQNGDFTPVDKIDALYLRMSQAEMTRLGKNGKV